ncbi:hypothetical protein OG746_37435 [Streptomyces sp. NBC_01016]|uniref:hypothetical protein n=1 Tax=Streptomyces sp. NBC_01016 TaxID=2903720 RepID=UPI00225AEC45|nr:hypothetical protein [Streptomyces sp. NBC_01016]MCX4834407.1 hypothetical protein [Streptomyces sp. NBC_01016]
MPHSAVHRPYRRDVRRLLLATRRLLQANEDDAHGGLAAVLAQAADSFDDADPLQAPASWIVREAAALLLRHADPDGPTRLTDPDLLRHLSVLDGLAVKALVRLLDDVTTTLSVRPVIELALPEPPQRDATEQGHVERGESDPDRSGVQRGRAG